MSLYVDPDDLAATMKITTAMGLDDELERVCFSASGAIDEYCDDVFQLGDDSNDEVRYFTAIGPRTVLIDSASSVTTVELDRFGRGNWDEEWTALTDYVLLKRDHKAETPYNRIRARGTAGTKFFTEHDSGVKVTGRFGWTDTPATILEAAGLLATQVLKRRIESPFGIVSFGVDQPTATRVLLTDPHLCMMLEPFCRVTEVG